MVRCAVERKERVRRAVTPNGTLGLRVPANHMAQDILRMLSGPVVLTSANRSGQLSVSQKRRMMTQSRMFVGIFGFLAVFMVVVMVVVMWGYSVLQTRTSRWQR